ncbi:tetratricopeptide repeat protein [Polyangium sp. y55x31]|uniref:tetratricopeptide repeat protein n=1 Tax=Polyangium sp. y55x31 TaxID=3042688 RepID=UPI0024827E8C|nr:tetratricopeptide repeat protein [Polyangium sp. y55x31]MDI1477131.1 tetratricopeptide repeat protein [Polyangium sp. y55x31]
MTTSCPVAADSERRRSFRFVAPALVGAALSLSTAPALANDPAAAEALFRVAKGLMEKKNYAEACPKFEGSYKLDPAVGTKLNWADCVEKQGQLARAWALWGEARDQAKREGDKPREDLAARRQKELDPRLPQLTVQVKGSVEGLSVYRDEVKLDPVTFGVPLPVDPGKHVVTLRRGSDVLKEAAVESKEKGKDEVTLDATDVPPPPPEQQMQPQQGMQGPGDKPKYRVATVRRSTGMLAGGVILGVVGGIVGLVGAGTVGLSRGGSPGGWATLGVGTVMFGGGIALGVIGNQKIQRKLEVTYVPEVFIGPSSVMVRGVF